MLKTRFDKELKEIRHDERMKKKIKKMKKKQWASDKNYYY